MLLWGDIERAKGWPSTPARLIGIAPSRSVSDMTKSNFLVRLYRLLFTKKIYNAYAKMHYNDVEVGVYRVSLYRKFNRHCTLFCKGVQRKETETIDVFYNPDAPHEAVFMPPSEHRMRGYCVWYAIKTFTLTFLLLYLFV